jgi:hypothetical protein
MKKIIQYCPSITLTLELEADTEKELDELEEQIQFGVSLPWEQPVMGTMCIGNSNGRLIDYIIIDPEWWEDYNYG